MTETNDTDQLVFKRAAETGSIRARSEAVMLAALAEAEAELCRRMDDLEVAIVEIAQRVSDRSETPPQDTPETDGLAPVLQDGIARVLSRMEDLNGALAAQPANDLPQEALDGLSRQLAELAADRTWAEAIAALEAQLQPVDLSAVEARLDAGFGQLQAALADLSDDPTATQVAELSSALGEGFARLETRLAAPEDSPVLTAVEALAEQMIAPEALATLGTQLETGLARIADLLTEAETGDGPAVSDALDRLRDEVNGGFDRIAQALGGLSTRENAARVGLTQLLTALGTITTRLDQATDRLDQPPADGDAAQVAEILERVQHLIAGLESAHAPLMDHLSAMETRLADRETVAAFSAGIDAGFDRLGEALGQLSTRDATQATDLADLTDAVAALSGHMQQTPVASPMAGDLSEPLGALHDAVQSGFDRIAASVGHMALREEAARTGLVQLLTALGTVTDRLDQATDRLDTRPDGPSAEALQAIRDRLEDTQVLEAITALGETLAATGAAQDLPEALTSRLQDLEQRLPASNQTAQLRAEIAHGVDRIAALVGSQTRQFEAEKRTLIRVMTGLNTICARIEAAASRMETCMDRMQSTPSGESPDTEARLRAIEQALARIEAKDTSAEHAATREAMRDVSMVVAEMLARHERLIQMATPGSDSHKSLQS